MRRSSPPSRAMPSIGAKRSCSEPANRRAQPYAQGLLRDHPVGPVALGNLRPAKRHVLRLRLSILIDGLADVTTGRAVRPLIGIGLRHHPNFSKRWRWGEHLGAAWT